MQSQFVSPLSGRTMAMIIRLEARVARRQARLRRRMFWSSPKVSEGQEQQEQQESQRVVGA